MGRHYPIPSSEVIASGMVLWLFRERNPSKAPTETCNNHFQTVPGVGTDSYSLLGANDTFRKECLPSHLIIPVHHLEGWFDTGNVAVDVGDGGCTAHKQATCKVGVVAWIRPDKLMLPAEHLAKHLC